MSKINKTIEELKKKFTENGFNREDFDVKRFNARSGKTLFGIFKLVPDSRVIGRSDYPLGEVLLLSFFAILGGANTWVDIAAFGRSSIKWLRKFAPYEKGTPSHDELRYIFGRVDHVGFQNIVMDFLRENIVHVRKCLKIPDSKLGVYDQWAIDGKEERATGRNFNAKVGDKVRNTQTLHVWDASNEICIFSKAIDSKTNEIPVAQAFLRKQPTLAHKIITFDALHTQKATLSIIVDKGGEYVAGLKGNQQGLLEDAQAYFTDDVLCEIRENKTNYYVQTEKAHSQIEKREYFLIKPEPDADRDKDWKGISSFVCCIKTITSVNDPATVSTETRYYVCSLDDVNLCAAAIRGHWFCEIGHWQLDHAFREDENSTMDVNAFENLSLLFKVVLALMKLLQATPYYKGYSVATIRKMFGWNLEENSKRLFEMIDKKAMERAISGESFTDQEKQRIDKMLEKMKQNPIKE